jgi:hypothetical protein
MPGRRPADAIRAYIDPLQSAVSCLSGVAKIVMSERVRVIGDQGAWILNSPAGMPLDGFGTLFAQQRFELVPTTADVHPDYERLPYRVSTREYIYRVVMDCGHEMRWHWHPMGNSHESRPHIHPSFNLKAHIPGPRYTLEEVIEACIELGAKRACDDWRERLADTGERHKKHRTWTSDPDERERSSQPRTRAGP